MVKLVDAAEFDVNRKTVLATKLEEQDALVCVSPILEGENEVLLCSHDGYFLRFLLEEVPKKKKSALGVHGIRLGEKDFLEQSCLLKDGQEEFAFRNRMLAVSRVKQAKREEKGSKLRLSV